MEVQAPLRLGLAEAARAVGCRAPRPRLRRFAVWRPPRVGRSRGRVGPRTIAIVATVRGGEGVQHHCLWHGDLRPRDKYVVTLRRRATTGLQAKPRTSLLWQRSCRNARCVARVAGDLHLVLTTVRRGYSPLTGSDESILRHKGRKSKGALRQQAFLPSTTAREGHIFEFLSPAGGEVISEGQLTCSSPSPNSPPSGRDFPSLYPRW